jgi:hypothetical protein
MYPTGDESEAIKAPPYVAQFDELYNLVNHMFLKVYGYHMKPPTPNK